MNILVIGAGLSGLSAAVAAKRSGHPVVVLERAARAGGVVRSERENGFLLEFGPNTVQLKPELYTLLCELGLKPEMEIADTRTPRYVLFNDKLHAVPMSPGALLTTDLLSLKGKLRLFKEPFVPKNRQTADETLLAFAKRRFGNEVADRLLAPFVSGVWAGDAEQLSAAAAFPKLAEWERDKGSVFLGMISSKKKKSAAPKGLLSFRNGMQTLIDAMRHDVGDSLHTNVTIQEVKKTSDGWRVFGEQGEWIGSHLVLSSPAPQAAALVSAFAPEAAAALAAIPYAPVAVLHLGFENIQIGRPRAGFGYLSAPSEKSDALGCLWNSNLFPNRAPDGSALFTVFMGGATNRPVLHLTDAQLVERATESLRPLMKLTGMPGFARVTRYDRAIPQYTRGHLERMKALERAEKDNPGLLFAANYRGGIAVSDVVSSAASRVR